MSRINRRRFLTLSGATIAGLALGDHRSASASAAPPVASSRLAGRTGRTTSAESDGKRTMVVVQLNGGNDGLSTLVPADGRYYDARPSLAIPAAEVVDIDDAAFGLHPALASLAPLFRSRRMTAVHGIGFPNPDRSHFVSMDRWWRADRMTEPTGWVGRWADTLGPMTALGAVAINGGAVAVSGASTTPAVVLSANSFALPGLLNGDALRAMAEPTSDEDLFAAVQASLSTTASAVEDFADIVSAGDDGDEPPPSDAAGAITAGLRLAGQFVTHAPATRAIVVNAGGFDTHANQLADHQELYADLAGGLTEFVAAVDAAGASDRVMLIVVSEFGRRVAENASGGTDHGAGGVAMVVGTGLTGNVIGGVDWTGLVDGDVPPVIDARSLFGECLTWLGAPDPASIVGRTFPPLGLFG